MEKRSKEERKEEAKRGFLMRILSFSPAREAAEKKPAASFLSKDKKQKVMESFRNRNK